MASGNSTAAAASAVEDTKVADDGVVGTKGKGKGNGVAGDEEIADVPTGDDEESEDAEEEGDEDVEPVEEDGMEEIDTTNVLARRTRGKQIDFAKAAENNPPEDDEEDEDDDDFEDSKMDEKMED